MIAKKNQKHTDMVNLKMAVKNVTSEMYDGYELVIRYITFKMNQSNYVYLAQYMLFVLYFEI